MPSRAPRVPPFRAIAECTYDWESWIDASGRLGWVNAAVERISGYTVAECLALERYPLPLVHPDDRARVEEVFRSAARGSLGNDVEFRVIRKDGATRWASVSWQPLVDGSGASLGFRASIRDIDDRKALEAQVHASRIRAEMADQAKTELLANVSHELRAPAHVVAGYAELLLEAGLPPESAQRAEVIRAQAALLLRQIEDLLDMASLESGGVSMERRPLRPETLLDIAARPFAPAAEKKGVALEVSRDPSLPARFLGDELRLSQILRNLVENAVEHTDAGTVRVALTADRSGPRLALVASVEDTGAGIAPELLDDVRRPFVRGGSREARGRAGKGLGLAIADRLARLMGGALELESALGRGTTARVTLPIEACDGEAPAPIAPERHADDGALAAALPLRVLVVDDTAASGELLAEQLGRLGYAPALVSSGRQAIDRARAERFDLVLVDVQMPEVGGAEVAAALAALPDRPRVVAVSASTYARDRAPDGHDLFDAFLLRPVGRARLAALLRELFGGAARAERPDDAELLDLAAVEDLAAARDATGKSMLERYASRAFTDVARLVGDARSAIAANDRAAAAAAFHAAAGLVASVGAARAADALRRLERDCATDAEADPAALRDAIDALEPLLRASERALAAPR